MADVIDFLEKMGQDAGLRHAPDAVLEQAMCDAQMNDRARAALMSGDRAAIEAAIGTQHNVCCMVFTPGEDEGESGVKTVPGIDSKVCCMVFTPGDEEQDPEGVEQQKAA